MVFARSEKLSALLGLTIIIQNLVGELEYITRYGPLPLNI